MTTQTLPENVIEVSIDVEGSLSEVDAFNTVAFFTVSDDTERNVKVSSVGDVLSAGFTEDSKAYNFCLGVFNQNKMSQVVLRSVRSTESYLDSYNAYSNNSYYFLVVDSKDIDIVLEFRQSLEDASQQKLMFFSSSEDVSDKVSGLSRLVYYYDTNLNEDLPECFYEFDSGNYIQLDSEGYLLPETCKVDVSRSFINEVQTNCKIIGATVKTRKFNYLNSYLYPIFTVESISTQTDLNSVKQRVSIGKSETFEEIGTGFSIKSATQKDVLKSKTLTPEIVATKFKIASVTQRDTLKTTKSSVESVSVDFSVIGATQKDVLIVTNNSVENLSTKFSLVSATIK